jgi:hypothetical protein
MPQPEHDHNSGLLLSVPGRIRLASRYLRSKELSSVFLGRVPAKVFQIAVVDLEAVIKGGTQPFSAVHIVLPDV